MTLHRLEWKLLVLCESQRKRTSACVWLIGIGTKSSDEQTDVHAHAHPSCLRHTRTMVGSVNCSDTAMLSIRQRSRGRITKTTTTMTTQSPRSKMGSAVVAINVALLASLSTVHAAPSIENTPAMQKRKAVLSDSDVLTIADKVPSDLIILIGVTMLFALMCLVLAIVNIRYPRLRSSHIADERAQARTDLRVRGAGQHIIIDRKQSRRKAGLTNSTVTSMSQATVDSKSHLISPQLLSSPTMEQYRAPTALASGSGGAVPVLGPRVADDRPSRASRGYSFYNKQDMLISGSHASRPTGSRLAAQRSANASQSSALLLPPMPRRHTDVSSDASSTVVGSSINGGSSVGGLVGPRPLPSHARQPRPRQPSDRNGIPAHQRVNSTTVGRGSIVNMSRNFDKPPWRTELPMPPQLIDPAYGGRPNSGVTTPRSKLPGRYDLHRTKTDPRDSMPSSRRNSFALGNGSPARSPSYFDGSGSESHSHEGGGGGSPASTSLQQHPLLPYSQMPRTRPLALYDLEADLHQSNHLTGLLDDDGSHLPRSAKASWNAYR